MIRRWIHLAFAVAAFGLAPSPVPAQAPTPRAQTSPAGRHFVWRVDKAGKPVAWLVGSVHILKSDTYPLPAVFDEAFSQTGTLVEEVDLGAANDPNSAMPMAAKALLTGGLTLSALLDKATHDSVEAKAEAAGVPMLALEHIKPWLVAMTLAVPALRRSGFEPAFGIDQHFYDRAKAAKRPVRGLETAAYQIDRLDELPMAVQVAMLKAVLSDADTQVTALSDIVAAWKIGDVDALDRLLLQEFRESPEVYRRLLVDRNHEWAPKIAACADEPSPCLVVVGGAHLVGPDSVVTLLRRAGFRVEQQ